MYLLVVIGPACCSVDDNIVIVRNDSHITGNVIYNDDKSAVIEIKEMTPNLFPFTLFYNVLIGKEKGPRLAGFIKTCGKEKVLPILKAYC